MGVDRGYGSGTPRSASNSASRANATRAAANRRRSGARTATARAVAARTAAATPSLVRDRHNPQIAQNIGRAVDYLFEGPAHTRGTLQSGVSPWKALAMYAARVARAIPDGANLSALTNVVMRSPRGPIAAKLQRGVAKGAMNEAKALQSDVASGLPSGYSTTMFPDHIAPLFRPSEIESVYRAMSKIAGRQSSTFQGLAKSYRASGKGQTPWADLAVGELRSTGRTLRDISRKGYK